MSALAKAGVRMELDRISEILSFSAPARGMDRLVEDHLKRVTRMLMEAVAIAVRSGDAGVRLRESIEHLEPPDVGRLIASPRVYCELASISSGNTARIQKLAQIIEADMNVRSGLAIEGEYWSADCEFGLISELSGSKAIRQGRIQDCIVVDFQSDWTRLAMEAQSGVFNYRPIALSVEMMSIVTDKISTAMKLIEEEVPQAGRLIRNFTRVIRIRFREGEDFGSEQVPRELGAIRLLNPHLASVSLLDVCDFLLHESVHNFLSAYENSQGEFVRDSEVPLKFRPVSPWSGRAIPLQSFCHAVYVYFALFRMFSIFLSSSSVAGKAVETRLLEEKILKVASGFMFKSDISDYLRLFCVSKAVTSDMDRLQGEVQRQVFHRLASLA